MSRAVRLVGLLLAVLSISACTWRVASPSSLAETVRIQVVADRGRLPRAGPELQSAVAQSVAYRTGWQVRGDGSARLDLSIDKDDFGATARDERDIASRWRYSLSVTALLVTANGTATWTGSGTGYAGSRVEENTAVRTATTDVADSLARWLAARP